MVYFYLNTLGLAAVFAYITSVVVSKRIFDYKNIYILMVAYISADNLFWIIKYILGEKRGASLNTIEHTVYILPYYIAFMIVFMAVELIKGKVFIEGAKDGNSEVKKSHVVYPFVFLITIFLYFLVRWVERTFNVGIEAIINTLQNNLTGTDPGIIWNAVFEIAPFVILFIPAAFMLKASLGKMFGNVLRLGNKIILRFKAYKRLIRLIPVLTMAAALYVIIDTTGIVSYVVNQFKRSEIFEEYYTDPKAVAITGDNTKNIIILYLESMETTTMHYTDNNGNTYNCMPNLERLAEDNICFSDKNGVGGYYNSTNASFTKAATVATTTGMPPVIKSKDKIKDADKAYEITALGDILADLGYDQEIMKGSDTSFADTRGYYVKHGNQKVFDLEDFYKKSYVPEGFREWWGVRDEILYYAAMDEITALYESGQKFAFSFYTIDTHPVEGYVCPICPDKYDTNTANIIACADKQASDFIEWCKSQEWYEDTVIVVMGDHVRMDSYMTGGLSADERRVYNCIINSSKTPQLSTENRIATTEDFFPTMLSAMGFSIEGDRLGIGTDLFSGKQTVAEILGIDEYNDQLRMKSDMIFVD